MNRVAELKGKMEPLNCQDGGQAVVENDEFRAADDDLGCLGIFPEEVTKYSLIKFLLKVHQFLMEKRVVGVVYKFN